MSYNSSKILMNKVMESEMLNVEIEKLPSYLIGKKRGEEQAIKRGAHRKAVEVAKKLFKIDMSLEQIAVVTELSIEELQQLKRD